MSQYPQQHGIPASARIDVHDAQSLAGWAARCGVAPERVRIAVAEVGTSALLVQAWLRTQAGLPPEP